MGITASELAGQMDFPEKPIDNLKQGETETSSPTISLIVEFAPGTIVADGRYRIISTIGRGAMGCVYEVEQIYMKKRLAMKVLLAREASDYDIRRFQKEAQAANRLDHPNLVHAVDFGMLGGAQPYLVMDLIIGTTLSNFIKETGSITVEQAIDIFIPVCLALAYAHHEGVVHRDIKPSNIILEGVGIQSTFIPKIVDFGIAKLNTHEETALTQVGEVLGTPLYMSPEQCAGDPIDFKSDIYSLGCVIFECLTGTPPFTGKNSLVTMMSHRHNVPPTMKEASMGTDFSRELETIMAKMLAKDPRDRYASCLAIAQDFEYLKRGEIQKVLPTSSIKPPVPKKDGKLTIVISIAVTLALLATIGVLAVLFKPSDFLGGKTSAPDSVPIAASTVPIDPKSGIAAHMSATHSVAPIKAEEDSGGYHFADVTEGGYCRMVSRQRLYEFPKSDAIGTLYWWTREASKAGEHLALGSFQTPADAKPLFDVGWDTLDHKAAYLTGFNDDFLYGAFVCIRANWNVWGNDDALTKTLKLLENHSKSLRILELDVRETKNFSYSEAQWNSLNRLKLVQWLVVGNDAASGQQVSRFSFFPRLTVLAVQHSKDCSLILAKLRASHKLERLSFFGCKFSENDLQALSQARSIKMLEFRQIEVLGTPKNTRSDLLGHITNLPNLDTLCIDSWNVMEQNDLKQLAKLKKLRLLEISDDSTIAPHLVANLLTSIRAVLPNCKVELLKHENDTTFREFTLRDWCDPLKINPSKVITWD